jgi:hypothetical protein
LIAQDFQEASLHDSNSNANDPFKRWGPWINAEQLRFAPFLGTNFSFCAEIEGGKGTRYSQRAQVLSR